MKLFWFLAVLFCIGSVFVAGLDISIKVNDKECSTGNEKVEDDDDDDIGEIEDIDIISFSFPRDEQTEDWVKYMLPFPQLSELTMCFWITPYSFGDNYAISYATAEDSNAFRVAIHDEDSLEVVFENDSYNFDGLDFELKDPTHLCIWFDVSDNEQAASIGVSQDGVVAGVMEAAEDDDLKGLPGRGSLVFGQEQDYPGGGFEGEEAFSGVVTNFMIWPRVLLPAEIARIARHCKYPQDVIIQPLLTNIEWNGDATVTFPKSCPVV